MRRLPSRLSCLDSVLTEGGRDNQYRYLIFQLLTLCVLLTNVGHNLGAGLVHPEGGVGSVHGGQH